MTTREEIGEWFDLGVASTYDFMLVITDTFRYEDYPVYVARDEYWDVYRQYEGEAMQQITESYDLSEDRERQLSARRNFIAPVVERT